MKKPTYSEIYDALNEVKARLEKREGRTDVYPELSGVMHVWLTLALSGEKWEVKHVLESIKEFK